MAISFFLLHVNAHHLPAKWWLLFEVWTIAQFASRSNMLILWFHISYFSIASSQRLRSRHVRFSGKRCLQISRTSGKIFAYPWPGVATGGEFIGNAVRCVSPDKYLHMNMGAEFRFTSIGWGTKTKLCCLAKHFLTFCPAYFRCTTAVRMAAGLKITCAWRTEAVICFLFTINDERCATDISWVQ